MRHPNPGSRHPRGHRPNGPSTIAERHAALLAALATHLEARHASSSRPVVPRSATIGNRLAAVKARYSRLNVR
jgi:hypothetical protein